MKRLRFTATEGFSANNGTSRIFEEGNIVDYDEEKGYILDDKGVSYKIHTFAQLATITEEVDHDGDSVYQPTEESKQNALDAIFNMHLMAYLDKHYKVADSKGQERAYAMMFISQFWASSQFKNELIRLLDETEANA